MDPLVQSVLEASGKPIEDKIALLPILEPVELEQLSQLVTPTWDGNLISKTARSLLIQRGLADRYGGLNFCTQSGYCFLDVMGMLGDKTRFKGGKR